MKLRIPSSLIIFLSSAAIIIVVAAIAYIGEFRLVGHQKETPSRSTISSPTANPEGFVAPQTNPPSGSSLGADYRDVEAQGVDVPALLVSDADICMLDNRIVYISDIVTNFQLRVRGASGKDDVYLEEQALMRHPGWASDCASIVFDSRRGENDDIWVLRLRDRSLTRLTNDPASDVSPTWSPDNTRILFVSDRLGQNDVWIMNADGSSQIPLTESVEGQANDPAWSSDSREVVFSLCGFSSGEALCDLAIINLESRQLRIITSSTKNLDTMPNWSPAGIVFSSDRGAGAKKIWMVQADGSQLRQITQDPEAYHYAPKWLPNGDSIIFSSVIGAGESSRIQRFDLSTQSTVTIIESVVDLVAVLSNSGFEDDLIHSQWTATKPNKTYSTNAPIVNPYIVPKGEVVSLKASEGNNFIGILNPKDQDISGKLVHSAVAGSFPQGTVFEVTLWANRGRLTGASTSSFLSAPPKLLVSFFGWGTGSVPMINPNTDNWSRRYSVRSIQEFTNWTANGAWAVQTFQFVADKELQFISLAIAGQNKSTASYVAFDIK